MYDYGNKLQSFGNINPFADSLIESGESFKRMAELKYALDDDVKQNYLQPMEDVQTKDLKTALNYRKKLQGRKLALDYTKRKGDSVTEDELSMAEDKFSESLHLAQVGMQNLLEGGCQENICQLTQLARSLLDYHNNCAQILQGLTETLHEKSDEASEMEKQVCTLKKKRKKAMYNYDC